MENTKNIFTKVQMGKPQTRILAELVELVEEHFFINYPVEGEGQTDDFNKWFSEIRERIIEGLIKKYPNENPPFFYTTMSRINKRPKYRFYKTEQDWENSKIPYIVITYN